MPLPAVGTEVDNDSGEPDSYQEEKEDRIDGNTEERPSDNAKARPRILFSTDRAITRAEQRIMYSIDKYAVEMNKFYDTVDHDGDGKLSREEMRNGFRTLKETKISKGIKKPKRVLSDTEIETILNGLFKNCDYASHTEAFAACQ